MGSGKIFAFDQTTFLYGNRGGYFQKGHFHLYEKPPEDDSQTLFACGGAFMVNRQKYLDLGGFDSMYHPLYYEPQSIAYHKVQATITRQEKLRRISLISARNN